MTTNQTPKTSTHRARLLALGLAATLGAGMLPAAFGFLTSPRRPGVSSSPGITELAVRKAGGVQQEYIVISPTPPPPPR